MNSLVFDTVLLEGEALLELIPQRPPIVMVDRFYGIADEYSYSSLLVEDTNLFFEADTLDEAGLIEHIAQSAALRAGYLCRLQGRPIPLGYIAALSKMHIGRLPKKGETLRTSIWVEQEIYDITLVATAVFVEKEQIASGKMKIYIEQDNG